MKLQLPYKGPVYFSSPFGRRSLNGAEDDHRGIDLVALGDKTVLAPCDGVVAVSAMVTDPTDRTWEWGNFVRIDTTDGYSVYLCHLAQRLVWEGRTVLAGEVIGTEGSTGYSFGSHCHLEVRRDGVSLDPCPFLGIENRAGVQLENVSAETIVSSDNEPNVWAKEAVNWALKRGVLLGKSEEGADYRLRENVTREEALVFLWRALGNEIKDK